MNNQETTVINKDPRNRTQIIKDMTAEGCSNLAICSKLGISERTLQIIRKDLGITRTKGVSIEYLNLKDINNKLKDDNANLLKEIEQLRSQLESANKEISELKSNTSDKTAAAVIIEEDLEDKWLFKYEDLEFNTDISTYKGKSLANKILKDIATYKGYNNYYAGGYMSTVIEDVIRYVESGIFEDITINKNHEVYEYIMEQMEEGDDEYDY